MVARLTHASEMAVQIWGEGSVYSRSSENTAGHLCLVQSSAFLRYCCNPLGSGLTCAARGAVRKAPLARDSARSVGARSQRFVRDAALKIRHHPDFVAIAASGCRPPTRRRPRGPASPPGVCNRFWPPSDNARNFLPGAGPAPAERCRWAEGRNLPVRPSLTP